MPGERSGRCGRKEPKRMAKGETWQRALIVGASSGIGAELARQLARSGCRVALVARRNEELERIASEIDHAAGEQRAQIDPHRALVYTHDVREYECVPALFQQIAHDLGGLDLVIYAAGVMPRLADEEYAFDKDRLTIEVNLLGAMAWLNEAARRFTRAQTGTIVGISSVAGDRGRRGMPVYCASKAALNTYLEALRNRVSRYGVVVVTVKPGPVATPMTAGIEKLPMMIPVQNAAAQILTAAARRKVVAYVPGRWRPIMFILRSIPSAIFRKLNV